MTDMTRKIETIRRIEDLQLPQHFIFALEHATEAEHVTEVLNCLDDFADQWN